MKAKAQSQSNHPKYANPTIAEVVCEFHFDLAPVKKHDDILPGELFKKFAKDFPEMRSIQELGFASNQGGVFQQSLVPRQRFKYANSNNPAYQLQLLPNNFIVNILPPYQGWRKVKKRISAFWDNASAVIKPKSINRIGLRYINRIPLTYEQCPSDWLQANKYIPEYILASRGEFLTRNEFSIDDKNKLIVTLGEDKNAEGVRTGMILDIDRITTEKFSVPKNEIELSKIEEMHDEVWDVFSSCKSQKLNNYLEGKLK